MPTKVYDLAKEYRISNTEMVKTLARLGYERLTPSSDLDGDTEGKARAALEAAVATSASAAPAAPAAPAAAHAKAAPTVTTASNGNSNGNGAPTRPAANGTGTPAAPPRRAENPPAATSASATAPAAATGEVIEVPANISIKELADKLVIPAAEIQKLLMGMGVLAGLNQRLAADAVVRIAQKMGKTVKVAGSGPATPAAPMAPETAAAPTAATPDATARPAAGTTPAAAKSATPRTGTGSRSVAVAGRTAAQGMVTRPPVVTIMGHVDHGKTTLLDAIRKADVAKGEAGGITQHIGAYQVEANGQRITFIDTPGHAAFSAMRQRGALVTDIIVIVVAADDSIMPQTEEAITIAHDAGLPIIVAVNKVDLPGADPDRVLTDLTRYEIVPEAFGGDVQTVNISAKTGAGISDLLDTILLVSEAVVEPKADPHGKAQGTVIEAKVEKGRGAVATVLVQQGTLTASDVIVAGNFYGKVRGMADDKGARIQKAGPSTPVEIVGLNGVPDAGDRIEVAKDEKEARNIAQRREQKQREERLGYGSQVTLEELYKTLRQGATKELNIVIKGDVQGSVQAVRDSLKDLGNDEVRARILLTAVGPINDNDILLAASDKDADAANSLVVGFNVGMTSSVEKKAEAEHVTVKTFSIIYELIDAVKESMVGLLDPIYEEVNLGKAEIRALFKLPGGRSIAGSYVNDGVIRRNAKARLYRGKELLYTGDIDTLKRFKDDAREVATGYECGLTLRDYNTLQVGDTIECFELRQIPREL